MSFVEYSIYLILSFALGCLALRVILQLIWLPMAIKRTWQSHSLRLVFVTSRALTRASLRAVSTYMFFGSIGMAKDAFQSNFGDILQSISFFDWPSYRQAQKLNPVQRKRIRELTKDAVLAMCDMLAQKDPSNFSVVAQEIKDLLSAVIENSADPWADSTLLDNRQLMLPLVMPAE